MNKILKRWKESDFELNPFFVSLLSYLPGIVITLFSGASNFSKWITGFIFLVSLIYTYIISQGRYKNVGFFLSLLFMAFWLIPTVEFILYEHNPKNYRVSEEFKKSEAILAEEKSKGHLEISDLDKILIEMNKISNAGWARRKPGSSPEDITGMLNIYACKVILIPEPIKLNLRDKFSIYSMKRFELDLVKNDSTKTTLFMKTIFPRPSDHEIIESLKREREEQLLMLDLKSGFTHIPYSEFLIDAVTAFSSDDISPTRNLPKALNGLQALIMVFLTTMIINSFGIGLTITRKEIADRIEKTMD